MVELRTDQFEATLNKYIQENDIENTIKQIIFPFLEKIGILWQTGHIMPAQEHFVSNIIRQKLIVAIDMLPCNREGTSCILFLPEGEYHELGLLFLTYLVKKQGCRITYLGASVPMKDVESIIQTMRPEIAFVHLTGTPANFNLERFLKQVDQKINTIPIIVSGYLTHSYTKPIPAGVQFKKSLSEVMEFIETI